MPVVDREQEQGSVDGKPRDHLLDELRRIRRAHDDLRAPKPAQGLYLVDLRAVKILFSTEAAGEGLLL